MIFLSEEKNIFELTKKEVICDNERKFVGSEGVEWWEETCEKHDKDLEVLDAEYTREQIERYEEVKEMTDIDEYEIANYIERGRDSISPSLSLKLLEKENERLRTTLADLAEIVLLGGM